MANEDYRDGPIDNSRRSCTDTFCCILLSVLVVAMFIFAIYAWSTNNFNKLTTPYDADGKGCGMDYPNYPYIYFVSPNYDTLWRTVCVSTCPTGSQTSLNCQTNKYVQTCNKIDSTDNQVAITIYPTTSFMSICMPTSASIQDSISSALGQSSWQGKFIALGKVWPILLISIPIAIILSVIFMLVLRFTAGIFVYLLLGLSIIGCLALGIYLICVPNDSYAGIPVNRIFVLIVGGLLIAFGVLLTIGLICFRKRIKLATIIVQVSARFVEENFKIIILPFILFFVMIAFLTIWILQALGYYSMGTPVTADKQLPFQHFQTTNNVKALIVFHIFHLFWVIFFLVETGDFLVSGAATSWFYRRQSPFAQSYTRYSRYHIGSVAMSSFFIALFGFLKFMYELLTPQKTSEEGCMSSWKKFCDCCCYICVMWIFNWLNSGAYTFIHLAGEGYCSSVYDAVQLRLKEMVCSSVVAFLSALFSVLIRVGITVLTVLICYIMLKNIEPYKTQVQDTTFTNIFIAVIAFAISSFFVSLYSQAMQTIYVCYLADREAGGSQEKAPAELKDFMNQAKGEGTMIE